MSGDSPARVQNFLAGRWVDSRETIDVVDPLNGEAFIKCADVKQDELQPFVDSLRAVPKSGLHNPFKNPERYREYGRFTARLSEEFRKPEVSKFLTRLTQRVVPKSWGQCWGETDVTTQFLENFGGDQVRFLARSFGVSGDHLGQTSHGYRWPYGPVALIAPFNFPLEIPMLQLMGALYMGNKPVLKVDSKVSIVMEQVLRMMLHCGMPEGDVDFINCDGPVMGSLLQQAEPRNTLFTGSSKVAEMLAKELSGKIKVEDAGFDWKIFGADVREEDVEYVAWQCDQDAYGATGQKCSAQSIAFLHKNWVDAGLVEKMGALAARRTLSDLTVGPVLTWTTDAILEHTRKLLEIPGARLLWGGEELEGHSIPAQYGAVKPTAVWVPLEAMDSHFDLVTTEVFGPFTVLTSWESEQDMTKVLRCTERMHAHLTAAVVSRDEQFRQHVLGHTVNGTTYAGIRARTTGAPQNHWFGPAGDPRGAGIGSPEAIKLVWSCHREVIDDVGPTPAGWTLPEAT
jgi:1-pyrroline-5-carboxylate dehydrogenase